MSRVGKKSVSLPEGVSCVQDSAMLRVKGPKGEKEVALPSFMKCQISKEKVSFQPRFLSKKTLAFWGMVRSLFANAVLGVSKEFSMDMKMEGVGYRAFSEGSVLRMQLGFSHDVMFPLPSVVRVTSKSPTEFSLHSICAQALGQTVAEIQMFRSPEPYKGKGVHRVGQYVRRKEGKKK